MQIGLLNKYSIIGNLPLFSGLSYFQKKSIASKSQIAEFKKGDYIYEESSPPDYFYYMVNGRVEIFHPKEKTKNRQEMSIEFLRRGDYFGSISCLTGHPHSVSARAINDSVVLRTNKKNFNLILNKVPQLAIFLSRCVGQHIVEIGNKKDYSGKYPALAR